MSFWRFSVWITGRRGTGTERWMGQGMCTTGKAKPATQQGLCGRFFVFIMGMKLGGFRGDHARRWSHAYRAALAVQGIEASMSRAGNCWANAVVESFFATLE